MICWHSNDEGPLEGEGGEHYKLSVVRGGVDCEIKIWQGGGGRRRNDGFT